jgi:hypothetical protein
MTPAFRSDADTADSVVAARWPQRSGKIVLQLALSCLARHYGIGVSARGQAGEGVRHWGAQDYKPLFEVAGE